MTPLRSLSAFYCSGAIISYNCSIQLNTENLYLTWRVTFQYEDPINITFDNTSSLNVGNPLDRSITATLTKFEADQVIDSTIAFTVQGDVAEEITLQCITTKEINSIVYVSLNSSGKWCNSKGV